MFRAQQSVWCPSPPHWLATFSTTTTPSSAPYTNLLMDSGDNLYDRLIAILQNLWNHHDITRVDILAGRDVTIIILNQAGSSQEVMANTISNTAISPFYTVHLILWMGWGQMLTTSRDIAYCLRYNSRRDLRRAMSWPSEIPLFDAPSAPGLHLRHPPVRPGRVVRPLGQSPDNEGWSSDESTDNTPLQVSPRVPEAVPGHSSENQQISSSWSPPAPPSWSRQVVPSPSTESRLEATQASTSRASPSSARVVSLSLNELSIPRSPQYSPPPSWGYDPPLPVSSSAGMEELEESDVPEPENIPGPASGFPIIASPSLDGNQVSLPGHDLVNNLDRPEPMVNGIDESSSESEEME